MKINTRKTRHYQVLAKPLACPQSLRPTPALHTRAERRLTLAGEAVMMLRHQPETLSFSVSERLQETQEGVIQIHETDVT